MSCLTFKCPRQEGVVEKSFFDILYKVLVSDKNSSVLISSRSKSPGKSCIICDTLGFFTSISIVNIDVTDTGLCLPIMISGIV